MYVFLDFALAKYIALHIHLQSAP